MLTGGHDTCLPITLARASLLGAPRVDVGVAGLGKVAGQMLFGTGGAIGKTGVVTSVDFVRASHCGVNV